MFSPPDCAGCGAVSSETVAELHRAHAAARDEWQAQLARAEARAMRAERELRSLVAMIDRWNAEVTAIIGRPPDTGISTASARKALEEE